MNIPEQGQTRKKFIFLGVSFMAIFTSLRYLLKPSAQQPAKIKMLTKDGTLVEVDAKLLQGKKRKIEDEEIHDWVNTKTNKK